MSDAGDQAYDSYVSHAYEIYVRDQHIDSLKAQVTQLREALEPVKDAIDYYKHYWSGGQHAGPPHVDRNFCDRYSARIDAALSSAEPPKPVDHRKLLNEAIEYVRTAPIEELMASLRAAGALKDEDESHSPADTAQIAQVGDDVEYHNPDDVAKINTLTRLSRLLADTCMATGCSICAQAATCSRLRYQAGIRAGQIIPESDNTSYIAALTTRVTELTDRLWLLLEPSGDPSGYCGAKDCAGCEEGDLPCDGYREDERERVDDLRKRISQLPW